jgi:peptide deformylase
LEGGLVSLGELMRAAGVVQRGDPILGPSEPASAEPALLTAAQIAGRLARAAVRFDLPREAGPARSVLDDLHATVGRAIAAYAYQGGRGITGIAAPQIGVDRAAVLVREPGAEFLELLNPRVVARGDATEHYEGCLSLFDWRGRVARPGRVEIEHQDLAGATVVTSFGPSLAASVAHEIDHLNKVLFDEVRVPGSRLIPVDEYRAATRPSSRNGTD